MLFSLLPEDPGGLNRWDLISQQRELKIKWYLVLFLNVYLGLENVPWESVLNWVCVLLGFIWRYIM
jgi:hypothetical protein